MLKKYAVKIKRKVEKYRNITLVSIAVFCCIVIFKNSYSSVIAATIADEEIVLKGVASAVAIDAETGRILYNYNAKEERSIASLTKMMTSIVLAETCKLDEVAIVPNSAAWVGGSELGLKSGDNITVYNLLVGMLLPSGNDCAYTSAIYVGGTMENFARMMNEKAKDIGCKNTHFVNSYGLDVEGHYSSAYDMALITRYAIQNCTINSIIGSRSLSVTYGKTTRNVNNTNRLLKENVSIDGGKTGYTDDAGRCLIISASNEEMRVITVILGAIDTNTRFNSAEKLSSNVLNTYTVKDLSDMADFIIKVPIIKGKEVYYESSSNITLKMPIKESEMNSIVVKQNIIPRITAPMKKGSEIGDISICIGDEVIYSTKIYLEKNIDKKCVKEYLKDIFENVIKKDEELDLTYLEKMRYN